MSIEELMKLIEKTFPSFSLEKGFQVKYQYERPHPHLIRVGLESKKYYLKLMFVYEREVSLFLGTQRLSYLDEGDWFYFERLVDYIVKRPMRWKPYDVEMPYHEYLIKDIYNKGKEFEQYSELIFNVFRDKSTVEKWESDFRSYVDMEIQRRFPNLKKPEK